jgi:hypothetical protein
MTLSLWSDISVCLIYTRFSPIVRVTHFQVCPFLIKLLDLNIVRRIAFYFKWDKYNV